MQEKVFMLGMIVLFFIILFVCILQNNRKNKRLLEEKLRRDWGHLAPEMDPGRMEGIRHYHMRRSAEERFIIDDITWRDLDMDRLFEKMNQTVSAPGEEYLYALLHRPVFESQELLLRENVIQYFSQEEEDRIKVQKILSAIGKSSRASCDDLLAILDEVKEKNLFWDYAAVALIAAAVGLFFYQSLWGLIAFLGVSVFNVITYMKDKTWIEPYFLSFRIIFSLLDAAEHLGKFSIPGMEKKEKMLSETVSVLRKARRGSHLLLYQADGAGGLESVLLDYLRMLLHVDFFQYNRLLQKVHSHRENIRQMADTLGYVDAMIAAASFRQAMGNWCIPILEEDSQTAFLEAEGLYHPLLQHSVENKIHVRKGVIITGSNASGKSTFVKAVAVNSILAQTIHTCAAGRLHSSYFKVMTSMALHDNLQDGESYYMVEIKSLNRILKESQKPGLLLCVIDEVLRGTNTIERIAASSRILAELNRPHVLPFAATHDIELSYILEDIYENYHFSEKIEEADVVFDYLLKKGRSITRNAIRLLSVTGYDPAITAAAQRAAEEFERTGVWTPISERG